MFGILRPPSSDRETATYLAPLDPTKFGDVRFAASLRRASEIMESMSAEARARSMACHPSTAKRRAVGRTGMSLSEEERHILDEMERTLRKQDRAFVDRVNSANLRSSEKRARLAMIAFIVGFTLLLVAFGWSVLVGALGFVVMLSSITRVREVPPLAPTGEAPRIRRGAEHALPLRGEGLRGKTDRTDH